VFDPHLDEISKPERCVEQFDGLFRAIGMKINDRTPERVLWAEFADNL
jgi:hypothetical protein